jgi:hypothetical protein
LRPRRRIRVVAGEDDALVVGEEVRREVGLAEVRHRAPSAAVGRHTMISMRVGLTSQRVQLLVLGFLGLSLPGVNAVERNTSHCRRG